MNIVTSLTTATEMLSTEEPSAWFDAVAAGFKNKTLAPYLGPGVSALAAGDSIPTSYEGLAAFFAKKVALPKRARGNPWASAQYIESRQHRATVQAFMREAFGPRVAPLPFHRWLSTLDLPLVVDTWYDSALREAFKERKNWNELQGIDRAKIGEAAFFRAYDAEGAQLEGEGPDATTLVYRPHGGVTPVGNFLVADSDYVEVLTEIDIQNPIPKRVQSLRTNVGFVFLGCRFHDQMLRTYARQILKRSAGPHYAVFDSPSITRMERRFVEELGLKTIIVPLEKTLQELVGRGAS